MFQKQVALEGRVEPVSVKWLEEDSLQPKFSSLTKPGEFNYQASKIIDNENNIQWSETFNVLGFPLPSKLKDQIHQSLEYFCKIRPLEDTENQFQLEIPSDSSCKFAFSLLFPNLRNFCNDFIIFDEITISADLPEGISKVVEGKNQFHDLHVCFPVNTSLFKEKYPTIFKAFSAVSQLHIDVLDDEHQKKAISYSITPELITLTW